MSGRYFGRMVNFLCTSAILSTGCTNESTGPGETGVPQLALSIAVTSDDNLIASQAPAELTLADGTNTLVLSKVFMVLREVELKRQFHAECDSSITGDDDSCEEFSAGPMLLELDLGGSGKQLVAIDVDPGTYDELEFDVHKPDDDTPDDLVFLLQYPQFRGVSIWVEGSFNEESFTFLQDLNEEQEIDLLPALVVGAEAADLNLTMSLDLGTWFVSQSGDLLDPRSGNKGGDNEELVEHNIKASIDLFRDDDRDGHRDD